LVDAEASVRSPSRRRAPRPGRIDGLKVRIIDDPTTGDADLGRALRLLARLMVRAHEAHGDHQAIAVESRPSSTLTVATHSRPDHDTNNEAA